MSRRAARIEGVFAAVPDEVLLSDACRTLPHPAHRVLVILAAQFHGGGNGSLTLTRETAKKYGIGNPHILDEALRELEERGLIVRTRPGSRLPPLSAMFALTWRRIDEPKPHDRHDATPTMKPSNAWAKWRKKNAGLHWTVEKRLPRWRRATRTSSAGIHDKAEISSARIHETTENRVARESNSYISGREYAA